MTKVMNIIQNIDFILIHPQSPENIGLACRALKNFGFKNLRIVGDFEQDKAQKTSSGSEDILKSIRVFSRIEEALKDCSLVIGTSRRLRDNCYTLDFSEGLKIMFSHARQGRVGLLFGREDRGLTSLEAEYCDFIIKIPAGNLESLNLSHAVLLLCYEIFVSHRKIIGFPKLRFAKRRHIEKVLVDLDSFLKDVGLPSGSIKILKRIFRRSGLTEKEVNFLRILVRKARKSIFS